MNFLQRKFLFKSTAISRKMPNLDREENLAFMSQHDISLMKFSPFFRWKVSMSGEQLEAILSHTLPSLYETAFICFDKNLKRSMKAKKYPKNRNSTYRSTKKRKAAYYGIEINTTHGIYKIIKEYNIRYALLR